jgi:WhiB family transcriptional regulator, redox-sensing transcriptional regulator
MRNTHPPVAREHDDDWFERAACRGDEASAFYPPLRPESKAERAAREQVAKTICQACLVRTQCLDHAMRNDERYGIWGGLTDIERRHLPRSA